MKPFERITPTRWADTDREETGSFTTGCEMASKWNSAGRMVPFPSGTAFNLSTSKRQETTTFCVNQLSIRKVRKTNSRRRRVSRQRSSAGGC